MERGPMPKSVCFWVENAAPLVTVWTASCGTVWEIPGPPSEHSMRFCPHCGEAIHERRNPWREEHKYSAKTA
jgi:predicted RNA-binding Zn-ribbon protein involved in translation (DUF1610 family)